MTDAPRPQASPAAVRPRPARPSRRKRFAVTLAAAAAGFVIVFQFLALQLQSGNDPALTGTVASAPQGSHVASAPVTGSGSPVVTRTSGGAQTVPASSTQAPTTAGVTPAHSGTHHPVLTSASGGAGSGRTHSDDLD